MTFSAFDSQVTGDLFADPETVALFSDEAQLAAMLRVEAALARVEGRLGVIPEVAAQRIAAVAEDLTIEPASLAAATTRDGMPVPALVAALREAVGGEAAAYVHWGATSQDIIDTGLVLRLREVLRLFEARLARLIRGLAKQAEAHKGSVMVARTRSQQATPTTFGLKVAGWLLPLIRHRERLGELAPRLLVLQFGGASGTLAALGARGLVIADELADDLDLVCPEAPWHNMRDNLGEFSAWLGLLSGALGKLGADVLLLGQSEVGELRTAVGGASSTMPQKANPVGAETLVALARFNGSLLSSLYSTLVHSQERDGVAWSLEWLTLPQMVAATGGGLCRATELVESFEPNTERMRENLEASRGLVLAEAASFALAAHMPKPEAEALVKEACAEVKASDRHLVDLLRDKCDAPLDWKALADPANHLGAAEALVERTLAEVREG